MPLDIPFTYRPFGYTPNPAQQAVQATSEAIQSQRQPWGFHEPSVNMGAGVEQGLRGASNVMSDPRNMWMGLGPLAMMSRPAGWGAEALRRYKLLGGTPETLNKTLALRPISQGKRGDIVEPFRKATDLAAPADAWDVSDPRGTPHAPWDEMSGIALQRDAMDAAGDAYQMYGQMAPGRQIGYRANAIRYENDLVPDIESATRGNAAYEAVNRQVARMLDSPEYTYKRLQYGP